MKLFSKFLAVFVALSLSLSLVSPALAVYSREGNGVYTLNTTEQVLEEHGDYKLILRAEDLSNGDARFSMVENGQMISCSYVNRSEGVVIYTQYENGMKVFSDITDFPKAAHSQSGQLVTASSQSHTAASSKSNFTLVGSVGYNHYIQGMNSGVNYISWAYYTNVSPESSCDLNGRYRDLAEFAAVIASGLGVLASFGGIEIARWVLRALGIYSLIGPFIIPSRDVSCVRTEVIWRASSFIKYRDIQGWRCVVTHDDGKQQIVYEGDYYPTNAIANHNSSLALAPYPHLYTGSDRYEIASWPK